MSLAAPPAASPQPTRSAMSWTLSWSLLLLGTLGFATIWLLLSLYTGRQNSWMAVIGAIDLAWMLRLGGWPRGLRRAVLGVIGTLAIIVLYSWSIASTQIGLSLGVGLIESLGKLGVHHAWLLTQLANGPFDWLCLATGLVVAAFASR